jgi:hypothetical protein
MTSTLSRKQDPAEDITPNFDAFLLGKKVVAKATRNPYINKLLEDSLLQILQPNGRKFLCIWMDCQECASNMKASSVM